VFRDEPAKFTADHAASRHEHAVFSVEHAVSRAEHAEKSGEHTEIGANTLCSELSPGVSSGRTAV
jgi:hypothetical protein